MSTRRYAVRLVVSRICFLVGFAGAVVFAMIALRPGGNTALWLALAIFCGVFALASLIYMSVIYRRALRREPRQPEEAED